MSDAAIRATRVIESGRRPKQVRGQRCCCHHGCRTRLSMYNRAELCWLHQPVKFPRLRGRPQDETTDDPADYMEF